MADAVEHTGPPLIDLTVSRTGASAEGDVKVVVRPALTNFSHSGITDVSVDGAVDTDKANGVLSYGVWPSGSPPADSAAVIAGTGAVVAGNQVIRSRGTQTFQVTGLTASSDYTLHVAQQCRDGKIAGIAGIAFSTTAPAASVTFDGYDFLQALSTFTNTGTTPNNITAGTPTDGMALVVLMSATTSLSEFHGATVLKLDNSSGTALTQVVFEQDGNVLAKSGIYALAGVTGDHPIYYDFEIDTADAFYFAAERLSDADQSYVSILSDSDDNGGVATTTWTVTLTSVAEGSHILLCASLDGDVAGDISVDSGLVDTGLGGGTFGGAADNNDRHTRFIARLEAAAAGTYDITVTSATSTKGAVCAVAVPPA